MGHHGQKASLVSLSGSQKVFTMNGVRYTMAVSTGFNAQVCVCVCVCVCECLESSKNIEENLSQSEEIPEDSIEKFQSRS